jgi:ABC-type dipeptide/oligopeptide/nickel transport system permease component
MPKGKRNEKNEDVSASAAPQAGSPSGEAVLAAPKKKRVGISDKTKGLLLYILKRILLLILTFIVIFLICFVMIRLLPDQVDVGMKDPEVFYMQMVAQGRMKKLADGTYVKTPIMEQLGAFLANLFTNSDGHPFGYSYKIEWLQGPETILFSHMGPTLEINLMSAVIAIPVGIALGIFMALKKNKWEDQVLSVLVMLVISVPSFVYAFLFQYLFGYVWQVLPPLANGFPAGWAVLPVMSLCFGSIAGFARYTRAELTEVLTSDFMLLARTKGLTRAQATWRHAFRNSLVPIFPMILGEFIGALSGSLIIENIFSVNGVGYLYLQSINTRDYDVFQFVSMFYIIIGLLGTLVVDLSYGIVDPRIRMGGGKQ